SQTSPCDPCFLKLCDRYLLVIPLNGFAASALHVAWLAIWRRYGIGAKRTIKERCYRLTIMSRRGEAIMKQKKSLRSRLKEIPVLGPAVRLANRFRISLLQMRHADMRKDTLLRMKHRVSWHISRNPQSQKNFIKYCPTLTIGQRELVESLTTKGVAAAS